MTIIKAATVQISPVLYSREGTVDRIVRKILELEQAVTIPSATTLAISEACRQTGMVVAIGVNERDGGTIYNTQLLFNADGTLIQRRRKITPTHHERMIWGQGGGSGLKAVDSAVGRIGQLACWEHYNPLARIYDALIKATTGGLDPVREEAQFVRAPLGAPDWSQMKPMRGDILKEDIQ